MSSLAPAAVTELAASFAGRLVQPGDAAYDAARRLHNGMIDKRPALIAQCRGTADVSDAIRFARASGLQIAVRGGGHNVAGRATVEGGLMVDLSLMKSVHVDPVSRTAWVDGGATWREVNRETQHYGLATTGGVVSTTGVAGLTLGGGFGWLMPKYAMALDNLKAARVVLADGRVVRAASDENPDLFWAIRGGGGNFGVVATFQFALHEVGPIVVGGLVVHPFNGAKEVLRFYRDTAATLPDEMFLVGALVTAPDGSGTKLAGIAAVHCGSVEAGEAAARPLKAFGSPVMDMLEPMPYTTTNMMLDASSPAGARNYWKSHFLPALPVQAIDALVGAFARIPSPLCQIVVEHFHGAATRVPTGDTAFALRDSGFNVLVLAQWLDESLDRTATEWCRDTYAALQPFVGPRRYLNYLDGDDIVDQSLAAVYGPNLPRLRKIKAQFDPENVFRLNLNVPPGP
jgi:FAD/FMN-containing dehydrogenase